jgi:hypothetical protein
MLYRYLAYLCPYRSHPKRFTFSVKGWYIIQPVCELQPEISASGLLKQLVYIILSCNGLIYSQYDLRRSALEKDGGLFDACCSKVASATAIARLIYDWERSANLQPDS